jgi:N-acetylglucosamine-6-phosphate deacetylase
VTRIEPQPERHAITAQKVFDGTSLQAGFAVIIARGRIEAVQPVATLPAGLPLLDLGEGVVAPGFVDIQVNGGGGVLLNAAPNPAGMQAIAAAHARFGTTSMLPTVITDSMPVMQASVDAAVAALRAQVPGVVGLHMEGPFLDPARKGAHPAEHVRLPTAEDIAFLERAARQLTALGGTFLVTVSPAHVGAAAVSSLAAAGAIVSLGHSDATAAQANAALAAGAHGFTHLFNAMSQLGHRAPGMVGAALADTEAYCGLIADGHHVDPVAILAALNAKGAGHIALISDAMPSAAGGPDQFELGGRKVTRSGSRLTLADGTLAGCDITMLDAVRYMVRELRVPLADVLTMATATPAAFVGRRPEMGTLVPGARADLVYLNEALALKGVWQAGTRMALPAGVA